MTSHNRREIPHPVLSPGGLDYLPTAEFRAESDDAKKTSSDQKLHIPIKFHMTELELAARIDRGEAAYVVLTDCVQSRIRERHQTFDDRILISLDTRDYYGSITIQSFITSTRHIAGFRSDQWTRWIKDILPEGVDLPRGAILAIANEHTLSLSEPAELQSCIQIVPSDRVEEGRFTIDQTNDHIHILVHPNTKAAIHRMRSNEDDQDKLWPSIYLSAITRAVQTHTLDDNLEKTWAKTVATAMDQHGIDASSQDDLDENALLYAQQIMGDPLRRIMETEDSPEDPND